MSLIAQTIKNPPAMWETWVRSQVWEDPWRRAWEPTPVLLPGESPWAEEPGGLQSPGSHRVRPESTTEGLDTAHTVGVMGGGGGTRK